MYRLLLSFLLIFVMSASASAGLEAESGTYQHSLKSVDVPTDYGVFEAKPTDSSISYASRLTMPVGGFELGIGARTGTAERKAFSAEAWADAKVHEDAETEANKAIIAENDAAQAENRTVDAALVADLQSDAAAALAAATAIKSQFQQEDNTVGASITAMKTNGNFSYGAEAFVTEDEVIPSARFKYVSEHGAKSLGVTANIGEDWVGFGSVIEF